MIRTKMKVDGMMCGMCEAHINEAVRKHFKVKKVSASRADGVVMILSEEEIDPDRLRSVIAKTGYTAGEVSAEPYEKKGLFGW